MKVVNNFNCRGFGPLLEDKLCLIFKLAPSVCRMTFPILASLLVRLVVLLPFQLLRLSLATPSRWTPLALSVFLHCVVVEISESVNFCVMEAIKLCRLDTPIIFIEARINLSRFVVTGCAAKTSATVTFPSLNLISLFAFCFNIWLNGVASYPSLVSWIKHSVDRFVIVGIFIPKLRLILILNSFLGSSDSLVFSELFHSLAPRPLAARSISDFLLTYLAT